MTSKPKHKEIKRLTRCCDECCGTGDVSCCCGSGVDVGRCEVCGRFCKARPCDNCGGAGYLEYRVGDDVEVFVCCWSPEYLKEMLYKPKKLGDTKTYSGKITDIIDEFKLEVRVYQKRKKYVIGVEEIYLN